LILAPYQEEPLFSKGIFNTPSILRIRNLPLTPKLGKKGRFSKVSIGGNMKAVILAGGLGTRLSEETELKPKPMVEVGGKPILWHIMNIYSAHGIKEFIVALGYKGEVIKDYFLNFYAINNDITIDLATGETRVHDGKQPSWKIHLVDTGLSTQTGGRLRRLADWLDEGETFMFTYGDGVADIDLTALLEFHKSHGKLASVTTVRSPARFGRIGFSGEEITDFYEKPQAAEGWINGGFFVLNRGVIDYIDDDDAIWERSPVERLVSDRQLMGYRHYGFWSCMDTLKEKRLLDELWNTEKAPWKIW
jgi:glucose-1-phosphate cytidylyltransferase